MNKFLASSRTPATFHKLYRGRTTDFTEELSLAEACRELDRLITEITLARALRFVQHVKRLPRHAQGHVREMSAVDLTVLFAHHLSASQGKLVTRHALLFDELSFPKYTRVVDLVEYGQAKYPQRFWHPGQKY